MIFPEGVTITAILTADAMDVDGVQAGEIDAPAACKRGHHKVQKLKYVQLGSKTFPLHWKPSVVTEPILVTTETATIRAQDFA